MRLEDIAPAQRRVLIQDAEVDVRGLSLQDVSDLIARFPEVIAAFDKGVTMAAVLKAGPPVVNAIIAAACGSPGNARAEQIAGELGVGLQAEILAYVLEATMPKGAGPFERLLKAAGLNLDTVRNATASKPRSAPPPNS